MELKHIHPEYENEAQRAERLKDTTRACLEAVQVLRQRAGNPSV